MVNFRRHAVLLNVGAGALPSEFRLFVKGWNETENGSFLFDEESAAKVMSAYRKWGVDLAIDLEHQMLGDATIDPSARDARGWCRLELRPDGSLWAVGVTWTPDGSQRLKNKSQRYVSPAFEIDTKTKQVTKIVNIAITAMPATHQTPALVAASLQKLGKSMNADQLKAALEAIKAGDGEAAVKVLEDLLTALASEEATEPTDPPADPAAELAASPQDPTPTPEEDEKDKQMQAARVTLSNKLARLTGRDTLEEQIEQVEIFRLSHLELETERQRLAAEKATQEAAERRRLCVELVTMGAEFPSTVWADDKASALKGRWIAFPIEELRSHVEEQRKARKTSPAAKLSAQTRRAIAGADQEFNTPNGIVTLSARELENCKQTGAKPEDYAALKALRQSQVRK